MLKEDNKILKYNHGEKSIKAPYAIYADLECLLKKVDTCHNNPEKSSTTKKNKHEISGYSLFTHCSFDATKNKLDYYRTKDCIKQFCKNLRKHAMKRINSEENEMISLATKENKSYHKQKVCYICINKFSIDYDDKNTIKLEIIVILLENVVEPLIMFAI